jgi:hypothetical protein
VSRSAPLYRGPAGNRAQPHGVPKEKREGASRATRNKRWGKVGKEEGCCHDGMRGGQDGYGRREGEDEWEKVGEEKGQRGGRFDEVLLGDGAHAKGPEARQGGCGQDTKHKRVGRSTRGNIYGISRPEARTLGSSTRVPARGCARDSTWVRRWQGLRSLEQSIYPPRPTQ